MGQRDMFTATDVEKLNKMYKCGNIPFEETSESSEIIDDKEEHSTNTVGTTNRPSGGNSANNYPVLNFLGNLVSAAIASGGK